MIVVNQRLRAVCDFLFPGHCRLCGARLAAGAELRGDVVRLTTRSPARTLHVLTGWALDRGIDLHDLTVRQPTLEDIYLRLTEPPEPSP